MPVSVMLKFTVVEVSVKTLSSDVQCVTEIPPRLGYSLNYNYCAESCAKKGRFPKVSDKHMENFPIMAFDKSQWDL